MIDQVLLALKLVFTCISDEGRGAAAVAAVQQRSTPEVRVQERDRAAQFGEREPRPDVLGRVPVKERHDLTRVHAFPQRVRDSVTDPVRIAVREHLSLEHDEALSAGDCARRPRTGPQSCSRAFRGRTEPPASRR